MNDDTDGKQVRRKRSWYRRRLRIRRALVTAGMVLLLAAACWQSAGRFFGFPTLHTSSFLPESFWTRGSVRSNLALMPHARVVHVGQPGQETYAYSVIPGGVRSVAELREVAARDYVVRRHFAGFDFSHARLVRAGRAREVYLSYRIRDRVYWTRKRVRLLAAELLLTDGKITARTRCGNQVSETPKPDVSDQEPATDVFDEPVAEIAAIGPSLPFRFPYVRPNLPGAEAIAPGAPELFAGGFHFPYVEFGVPIPHGLCKPGDDQGDDRKKCKHHHKPPAVPEPASLVLISSGMAIVGWRYRRTCRTVRP